MSSGTTTKKKDDNMFSRTAWNSVAQVADDGGGVIGGTAITAGQEVLYSKLLRRFFKGIDRGWMDLIIFSLVTAGTDMGLGGWMGERPVAETASWQDTFKETFRPLGSVILVNYILKIASLGVHNPIKSFGFKELLVQLAAKEMAYIGNGILSKNIEAFQKQIRKFEALQRRQHLAARWKSKETTSKKK